MSPECRVSRSLVMAAGGLLSLIGVIHDFVNIPALTRAVARGDIAARLGRQLIANVAFGGLALLLLGVLLMLIARDLGRKARVAWRMGVMIGLFLVIDGVAAYLWLPVLGVLLFSVIGGLVAGPLLLWRREFLAD
jgi:hypothetical protein